MTRISKSRDHDRHIVSQSTDHQACIQVDRYPCVGCVLCQCAMCREAELDRYWSFLQFKCTCCRYQRPGRAQLAVWRRLIVGCFADSTSECDVRQLAPALLWRMIGGCMRERTGYQFVLAIGSKAMPQLMTCRDLRVGTNVMWLSLNFML